MPYPQVVGLNLKLERVCIYARDGKLLWYSPAWFVDGIGPANRADILGYSWQEHVHHEDYNAMIAWFRDPQPGTTFSFRFQLTSSRARVIVTYHKLRYRKHWLCVGAITHCPVVWTLTPFVIFATSTKILNEALPLV